MPKIGETSGARERGYQGTGKRIWVACVDCGKERWVLLKQGYPVSVRCRSCAGKNLWGFGENNPHWQGGRFVDKNGYTLIKLHPDNFFYPMTQQDGYVYEHRLVMAKHLGRCLQPWEIVHHKDGIKDNNSIDNLEMTSGIGEHSRNHSKGYKDGYAKGLIDGQNKQIQNLKEEIRLLKEGKWKHERQ